MYSSHACICDMRNSGLTEIEAITLPLILLGAAQGLNIGSCHRKLSWLTVPTVFAYVANDRENFFSRRSQLPA